MSKGTLRNMGPDASGPMDQLGPDDGPDETDRVGPDWAGRPGGWGRTRSAGQSQLWPDGAGLGPDEMILPGTDGAGHPSSL